MEWSVLYRRAWRASRKGIWARALESAEVRLAHQTPCGKQGFDIRIEPASSPSIASRSPQGGEITALRLCERNYVGIESQLNTVYMDADLCGTAWGKSQQTGSNSAISWVELGSQQRHRNNFHPPYATSNAIPTTKEMICSMYGKRIFMSQTFGGLFAAASDST